MPLESLLLSRDAEVIRVLQPTLEPISEAGAITDAVSLFFARDMTPEEGATALAAAVAGSR